MELEEDVGRTVDAMIRGTTPEDFEAIGGVDVARSKALPSRARTEE